MNIAIVDSSTDIEFFKKNSEIYSEIITLDYDSDRILSSKNILHKTSDELLSKEELKKIQRKSYEFSKWYELDELSDLISYEEINLGELFYVEFHYFLVPFLKKFLEISKIVKKFPYENFHCSGISFEITSQFSNYTTELKSLTQKNDFVYDSIKKSFKLGKKEFSLSLSRTKFKKIKNKSESLFEKFFHPKKEQSYDTLFIEFDPIKYKTLFTSLPKTDMKGLFLGLRRPAIWNQESFSIFKKSKCDLVTLNYLLSELEKNKIVREKKLIKKNLEKLENHSCIESFFSFEEISFWNLIKKYFLNLSYMRMTEFLSYVIAIKILINEYKIKTILLLSEQSTTEKIVLHFANKFKIPVFMLQHGYYHDSKKSFEFLDFMGNMPRSSTKILVWGKIFEDYLKNCNIDKQKILPLGNSVYDELFSKTKNKQKNDYVLLATSGPVDNIAFDLKSSSRKNYVETIKQICSSVIKNDKKLIIKLHPWQEEFFPSEISENLDPSIQIIKEKNIIDLIKNCSIFITIDISTTILEAFAFKKPVISVSTKDYDWGEASIFSKDYCKHVSLSEFHQEFEKVISDESYRENLVNNGNDFLENYLINFGRSSTSILKFLQNYPNS